LAIYCINEYAGQPLTAFNAVTGSTTNGTIDLTIDFPANTAYYGRVDIRRIAGASAPNADCASDGTVVKTFNTFADNSWTDTAPVAGGLYSYRACVYDDDVNLINSLSVTKTSVYSKGTYHVMFATSTTYQGNFGGLASADAICAARASAGGLSGTWIALLSTSTVDAKDRIYEDGPFYNILGQLVANNETDLWDGSIAATLTGDESGSTSNGTNEIYTGSNVSGTADNRCGDWTLNGVSDLVRVGNVGNTNSSWFYFTTATQNCSILRRILCVSHVTIPNLSAFTAATGATTDGDITLSITYPGDTSKYGRVDIRRLAETSVPSKDCSTNGTLVTSITNMSTTSYTDATGSPGRQFTYRACVYDLGGNLVATTPSSTVFSRGTRHTIFFTNSASFNGNLGGLSGADASCTAAANAAGLTGSWKALLSTETVHAKDRVAWAGPIYNTVDQLVAASSTVLFSGTNISNFLRDEVGGSGSAANVGVGSNINGTSMAGRTCTNWTTTSGITNYGIDNKVDTGWIYYSSVGCNTPFRIYCAK